MLSKLKKSKSEGFTIIEVMIVLAIAALILLIVLLAVPALQRSSRNTQRKNDAAAIGSTIANFISNNGGSLPNQVAGDGTNTNNLVISASSGTTNTETAKLGYYTVDTSATGGSSSGKVYINNVGSTLATPTVAAPGSESSTAATTQSVIIEVGENCDSTGTKAGSLSPRTAAIFYVTETGSGNGALQCVEQ